VFYVALTRVYYASDRFNGTMPIIRKRGMNDLSLLSSSLFFSLLFPLPSSSLSPFSILYFIIYFIIYSLIYSLLISLPSTHTRYTQNFEFLLNSYQACTTQYNAAGFCLSQQVIVEIVISYLHRSRLVSTDISISSQFFQIYINMNRMYKGANM
jgi:hypothetical protein